jgi:hypothetical protein
MKCLKQHCNSIWQTVFLRTLTYCQLLQCYNTTEQTVEITWLLANIRLFVTATWKLLKKSNGIGSLS